MLAQQNVVEVVRVEDVMPVLASLLNSGANQIAEFVPLGGNLQGSIPDVHGIFKAVGGSAANGAAFFKAAGAQLPIVGSLLSTKTTGNQSPAPTLAPLEAPEEAARLAAMAGAAGGVAKNTATAVVSMPATAVAHGANTVGSAFNSMADNIMAKPSEINQLLQFQHALWGNFLAGAEAANAALPAESLRNEIMGLAKIQPHLTVLLDQFENPAAQPILGSLGNVFELIKVKGVVEDAESPGVLDPTGMKLALANVALSFLDSISPGATTRLANIVP